MSYRMPYRQIVTNGSKLPSNGTRLKMGYSQGGLGEIQLSCIGMITFAYLVPGHPTADRIHIDQEELLWGDFFQ